MSTPEQRATRERLYLRVAVLQFVAVLALIVAVWIAASSSREALRQAQLRGCERGKLDRAANSLGWRTAEAARRASGTVYDIEAARVYAEIATAQEQRSRINCATAFPKP